MNKFRLEFYTLLFLTFFGSCSSYDWNLKLIVDFFKYKEIYFVNIHRCFGIRETAYMLKEFYKSNIYYNTIKPTQYSPQHYFHHRFGFVTDVNCENWDVFLEQNIEHIKFRIQKHGLLFCNSYDQYNNIKEKLERFNFKLHSNVYIVIKTNTSYNIYEAYNVLSFSKRVFTKTGTYANGKFYFLQLSRYERRRNFGNVFLNVAFVITKPTLNLEEYLADERTKQYDTSSKVNFGVFHHTVDVHNFRYNIVPTPGWFSSTRQGIEAGLGYAIFRGVADISGSSGLMTIGRSEAFDFLVGTFLFRTCFLYRNIGSYKIEYDEYIKPFSIGIWLCTSIFIGILCLIFLATQFVERRIYKNINVYSIYSILLNIISAFCQQGVDMENNSSTSHVILLTLLILSFIWYNYYTSSILSSLINNKPEAFKSVEALIKSDLKVGIENIAFKRIFNATNHPTLAYLQELAEQNNSKVGFYPQMVGIANIQNIGFAYLAEAIAAYNYIAKNFTNEEICDLSELEAMSPTMLYLVGKKNGPFNEMLSITYRRFVQHGLIQRQNKILYDVKPECLSAVQFTQIGIEQVAPAFMLLILGYIISVILSLVEKCAYKVKKFNKHVTKRLKPKHHFK